MGNLRITAIGEILWDVYPDKKRLGGAPFNFIYHVWKILGSANFISNVGNDEYGKEILNFLDKKKFPADFIYIDNEHPTGTVTVKLNDDKTPQFKISAECCYDYITLNEESNRLINEETGLLYFGTLSQRGNISRDTIELLLGKKIKYFCDLNLRHNFFSEEMIEKALDNSNVIKLNIDELNKLKSIFGLSNDDVKAMEQLKEKYNIDLISVTLGENGALLFDGNKLDKYKVETKNIVDTVGAGDAFAAILCIGYLKNLDIKETNKLANEFASLICGVEGALPTNDSIYSDYIKKFE